MSLSGVQNTLSACPPQAGIPRQNAWRAGRLKGACAPKCGVSACLPKRLRRQARRRAGMTTVAGTTFLRSLLYKTSAVPCQKQMMLALRKTRRQWARKHAQPFSERFDNLLCQQCVAVGESRDSAAVTMVSKSIPYNSTVLRYWSIHIERIRFNMYILHAQSGICSG